MNNKKSGVSRRTLLGAAAALLAAPAVHAQTWPNGAIRIVVGYPPGGTTDHAARVLGKGLGDKLGVAAVVENKPGAGSLIATQTIQHAPPDGNSILLATNALVIMPVLVNPKPYDAFENFAPVSMISTQPIYVVVRSSLGVKTIAEFIALAKSKAETLNFASSGLGTGQHIAGEMFAIQAGIKLTHVPYRGTAPAMIDLIAGRTDVMFTGLTGFTGELESGRLRVLANTGTSRAPGYPDVPTTAESGLPNYQYFSWQGVVAPRNTPDAIIEKLNVAVREVGAGKEFIDAMATQSMQSETCAPAEMRARLLKEHEQLVDVVKRTGIRM